MKLIFNHSYSIFSEGNPLIYLEAIAEDETPKWMFENGWVPWGQVWYQTCAARLRMGEISKTRLKRLKKLNISDAKPSEISAPNDIEKYESHRHWDFFFDDLFWGRVNFYGDQIFYSCMSQLEDKKSYGTLSIYYLIDKFRNEYEYLYIADYYEQFSFKEKLPGFQKWTGSEWV